jgi:hypothetical protein
VAVVVVVEENNRFVLDVMVWVSKLKVLELDL